MNEETKKYLIKLLNRDTSDPLLTIDRFKTDLKVAKERLLKAEKEVERAIEMLKRYETFETSNKKALDFINKQ